MLTVRDERGMTFVELLVGISMTLIVLAAVATLTTSVLHHQDRIVRRVDANSRARPVMTRMVQDLHSACVTSHIVPIRPGSTGTSISFLSKRGDGVGLIPDLHNITLSGGTLTERRYRANGNTPPDWGGFTTPIGPERSLLTNVSAPGGTIFRYYRFNTGALSTTPLPVPLTIDDASQVSYVTITFASSPSKGISVKDPGSPLVMNSGVDLRLENASQYPNQDNLPCV
jgi:Tfp pilus assembly protein PilW